LQSIVVLLAFLVNTVGPLPLAQAQEFRLPAPGVMVHLSPPLDPPILKGIKIHPDNPFKFDFILDQGDGSTEIKQETNKLIKYFLASLTIPGKDLWVNLSPYEKNRIVPTSFGLTEMGRDLLAEDYMLKQITASLIYPEGEVGKRFWKRIYQESARKFGTTNIPVNTFNKVWIVPDKAVVYENAKAGTAYVVGSTLKVMLEQDYLALHKQAFIPNNMATAGSNIVREIVIPELTKEVNEDKNFSQLRQVYGSLILATWYKKKIKDSILAQVYADKEKVAGVGYKNTFNIEAIYQRYLQAFKKGVYNYIKEEQDPITQQIIPRKYFSGGLTLKMDAAMSIQENLGRAERAAIVAGESRDLMVSITVGSSNKSMRSRRSFLRWGLKTAVVGGAAALAIPKASGQSNKFVVKKPVPVPRPGNDNPIRQKAVQFIGSMLKPFPQQSSAEMILGYADLPSSDSSYGMMYVYNAGQAIKAFLDGSTNTAKQGSRSIGRQQVDERAITLAESLLLLQNTQTSATGQITGWWYSGYDVSTGKVNINEKVVDVGGTATAIRALAELFSRTGDNRYFQAATQAMDYLIALYQVNSSAGTFFKGGDATPGHPWVSTEQNSRIIMALHALWQYAPENEKNQYVKYTQTAQEVAQWMTRKMWNGSSFYGGYDDSSNFTISTYNQLTDAQFMPIIALDTAKEILYGELNDPTLNPQNYTSLLNSAIVGNLRSVIYKGHLVRGWPKVSDDQSSIWLEGTLEGVCALYVLGTDASIAMANTILKSIEAIQDADTGGVPSIIDNLQGRVWPYNFTYLDTSAAAALNAAEEYYANPESQSLVMNRIRNLFRNRSKDAAMSSEESKRMIDEVINTTERMVTMDKAVGFSEQDVTVPMRSRNRVNDHALNRAMVATMEQLEQSMSDGTLLQQGIELIRKNNPSIKTALDVSKLNNKVTGFDISLVPLLERIPRAVLSDKDWGIFRFTAEGITYKSAQTGETERIHFSTEIKPIMAEIFEKYESEYFSTGINSVTKTYVLYPFHQNKDYHRPEELLERGSARIKSVTKDDRGKMATFLTQDEAEILRTKEGITIFQFQMILLGILENIPHMLTTGIKREDWYWIPKESGIEFINKKTSEREFTKYVADPSIAELPSTKRIIQILDSLSLLSMNKAINALDMAVLYQPNVAPTAYDKIRMLIEEKFQDYFPMAYDHYEILEGIASREHISSNDVTNTRFTLKELQLLYSTLSSLPQNILESAHDQYFSFRPVLLENFTQSYPSYGHASFVFAPLTMRRAQMLRNIIISKKINDYLSGFSDEYLVDLSYVRIQLHEKAHRIWSNLTDEQRKAYSQISWDMNSWDVKNANVKLKEAKDSPQGRFLIRYPFVNQDHSEEDFVDHVSAYVLFGPQFRAEAKEHPAISEKYELIKQVFAGLEYEENYDFEKGIAEERLVKEASDVKAAEDLKAIKEAVEEKGENAENGGLPPVDEAMASYFNKFLHGDSLSEGRPMGVTVLAPEKIQQVSDQMGHEGLFAFEDILVNGRMVKAFRLITRGETVAHEANPFGVVFLLKASNRGGIAGYVRLENGGIVDIKDGGWVGEGAVLETMRKYPGRFLNKDNIDTRRSADVFILPGTSFLGLTVDAFAISKDLQESLGKVWGGRRRASVAKLAHLVEEIGKDRQAVIYKDWWSDEIRKKEIFESIKPFILNDNNIKTQDMVRAYLNSGDSSAVIMNLAWMRDRLSVFNFRVKAGLNNVLSELGKYPDSPWSIAIEQEIQDLHKVSSRDLPAHLKNFLSDVDKLVNMNLISPYYAGMRIAMVYQLALDHGSDGMSLLGLIKANVDKYNRFGFGTNAAMSVGEKIIKYNTDRMGSEEFQKILLDESIGGPAAGPGHAAVNGYIDPEGKIVAFGNIGDVRKRIADVEEQVKDKELFDFTIRVKVFQKQGPRYEVIFKSNPSASAKDRLERAVKEADRLMDEVNSRNSKTTEEILQLFPADEVRLMIAMVDFLKGDHLGARQTLELIQKPTHLTVEIVKEYLRQRKSYDDSGRSVGNPFFQARSSLREGMSEDLVERYWGASPMSAMNILKSRTAQEWIEIINHDNAMLEKGGIDFTPAKMNVETEVSGQGIKFHINPQMLKELQNAPGLIPVRMTIQPMQNIEMFLGLVENKDFSKHS
jgi:hypothetical protein